VTTAAIEAGQAAWKRLQERPKATWQDWLVVGQALVVGRAEVMQEASTNRPFGLRYSRLMKKWLTQNGLNDINDQERYRVILCLENLSAIEKWRNDLPWAQRVRLNNAKAVWGRWKKSTTQPKPENRASRDAGSDIESLEAEMPKERYVGRRQIHWDQDAIQRAAAAIRSSYSTDFIVMARRALEAAVRDETDLMALLPAKSRKAA
jgi:hypothetical protein